SMHDAPIRCLAPSSGHGRPSFARAPHAHPHHVGFRPARRRRAPTRRAHRRDVRVFGLARALGLLTAQPRVLHPQAGNTRFRGPPPLPQRGDFPRHLVIAWALRFPRHPCPRGALSSHSIRASLNSYALSGGRTYPESQVLEVAKLVSMLWSVLPE